MTDPTNRPPIPPEWHGILNTLTECTTYAGAGLGKTEWLALRAALSVGGTEPTHDTEMVDAVSRVLLMWEEGELRHEVAVLDALADEGYEVVQLTEVEARAKSQLIMAGWASSVDVDDLHERIAELAAENRALEARNAKLAAQNNSLWANLGGGDADDREASEGSAAPASSPPPSSADHFAPDDEGLTDYGGWFPPADENDIDGVAEWPKGVSDGALRAALPTVDEVLATLPTMGENIYEVRGHLVRRVKAKVLVEATLTAIEELRNESGVGGKSDDR